MGDGKRYRPKWRLVVGNYGVCVQIFKKRIKVITILIVNLSISLFSLGKLQPAGKLSR
jgi:hypothetical protein